MESAALEALLARPADGRRLGPFQLDASRRLGKGGFAPVYLADEVHAGIVLRTVALKIFGLEKETRGTTATSGDEGSSAGRARIVEEARALCRVEHPNVVRFYALCTDEELGLMGLAMEHLAGTPLSDVLALGPCSIEATIGVGESVASALAAVHHAGLIHRDIKPANIIDAGGVYKLIDFGIASAKAPRDADTQLAAPTGANAPARKAALVNDFMVEELLTRATATFAAESGELAAGTMGYIDPACAAGSPASPASDLYSLGASLFECLTGKLPAAAAVTAPGLSPERQSDVFGEVLFGKARPPSVGTLRDGLPSELVRVVDELLAPDPAERPRSAESVVHTLARIRAELKGRSRPLPPEAIGPFRGLGRFEDGDQDVFFGRSGEIAAAVEVLRTRSSIALIGPSGSGKSSLARAGVAPAVAQGALGAWPSRWKTVVAVPGERPWAAIAGALGKAIGVTEDATKWSAARLAAAVEAYPEKEGVGVLLLVDQLEELVTLSKDADEATKLLVALGERCVPGVRVVSAARRDLLDGLLALPNGFGKYVGRGMQLVSPLSDAAWSDVLQQALSAYGYRFEDDALRLDVLEQLSGTISAMPLVQFALTQLWSHRDTERRVIARKGLEEIGGIAGALQRHAEQTFAGIDATGQGDAARRMLLALTTAQGTRAKATRKRLLHDDPARGPVIDELTEARLVVEEPDGLTLAHEALLTQWPRLRDWAEAVRVDRLLADELERAAAAWRASGDATLLWRKRRLSGAQDLLRTDLVEVGGDARAFVGAARSAQVRSWIIAGIGAAALAAVGVGATIAYIRTAREGEAEAQRQRDTAIAAGKEAETAKADALESLKKAEREEAAAKEAKKQAEDARKVAEIAQADSDKIKNEFVKDLNEALDRKDLKALEELRRRSASLVAAPDPAPTVGNQPSTPPPPPTVMPVTTGTPVAEPP